MTDKQRQAIERHGRNLQAIFPKLAGLDPVTICRRLRRLEVAANAHALAYCNGDIEYNEIQARLALVLDRLDKLINFTGAGVPVFINRDPRGYAMKIKDEYVRAHGLNIHRDMGGYGIIAPEIGKDGEG